MHLNRQGVDRHSKLHREVVVGTGFSGRREEHLQSIKFRDTPRGAKLLAQPFQRLRQNRQRPALLKHLVRGRRCIRFEEIQRFRVVYIERDESLPAAALLRPGLVPDVREKVFQRSQQKRPEFPLPRAHVLQELAPKHANEKLLGQILRVMPAATLPS
jgi:hypothetical protein